MSLNNMLKPLIRLRSRTLNKAKQVQRWNKKSFPQRILAPELLTVPLFQLKKQEQLDVCAGFFVNSVCLIMLVQQQDTQ